MIQLIKREPGKFYFKINGFDYLFMPMHLFKETNLLPLNRVVKGSTLGWHVSGKFVSYNVLRDIIKHR